MTDQLNEAMDLYTVDVTVDAPGMSVTPPG